MLSSWFHYNSLELLTRKEYYSYTLKFNNKKRDEFSLKSILQCQTLHFITRLLSTTSVRNNPEELS